MHVHVCVQVHWRPEDNTGCHPQECHILPVRQTSLELTSLARLAGLGFEAHSTVSDVFTLWVLGIWTHVLVLAWPRKHCTNSGRVDFCLRKARCPAGAPVPWLEIAVEV